MSATAAHMFTTPRRSSARTSTVALAARTVAWLLAFALFSSAAFAQETQPVFGWDDDDVRPVTVESLAPVVLEAPWFESWTWWIWLDSGEFLQIEYLLTTFGFGIEEQGSVRAVLIDPGAVTVGESEQGVYRARRGFEREAGEWDFASDGFDVWMQDCAIRGDGRTFEVVMLDDTLKAELLVTAELPLWRPGDGRIEMGWDHHSWYDETVLPRLRVEGRVSRKERRADPETWTDVTGVGYMEHVRTNAYPFEVGRSWHGFRALRDDGLTLLFDSVNAPDGFEPATTPWVLVGLDGEILFQATSVVVTPVRAHEEELSGSVYTVPDLLQIEATNGADAVSLRVRLLEQVSRDNPLSRLSRLIRAVLARLMAPMDYEQRVEYEAWIRIDGHTAWVSGTGWATYNFAR